MFQAINLLSAFLLDCIIGDPKSIPHPVTIMGKCINWMEIFIRKRVHNDKSLKWSGILFPLVLVGGSYFVTWFLLYLLGFINIWFARGLNIWLISTTIAAKGLAKAGLEILHCLKNNEIQEARYNLSMVVGRDTNQLDQNEISRGAVETVAENIVDAIISPLFFAAIGGAPLAMAYRAANTLDSMVGYKNDKYINLGWASARFDDLANYIPARLAAILLVVASWILKYDWKRSWKIIRRDARLHPSPNSGFTEAGVAGALNIQLGGINYYNGIISNRAKLGDPIRPIQPIDIDKTIRIMWMVTVLFLIFFLTVHILKILVYNYC